MTFGLGTLRRRLLSSVHQRPLPLGEGGPVVSFCFDDFPRTAYIAGGGILKSFGVRGTYYASVRLMGTSNTLGEQFVQRDLDRLLDNGHELGCHTYSHISCRNVPFRFFEADVEKDRVAIHQLTGYDAGNFAYPYGHVSLWCKRRIGGQVESARGIFGGINGPIADLNLLRANSLYGHVESLPAVHQLIAETVRRRAWLIFYTHDVTRNHSPFGCTPSLLDAAIDHALHSGCRIVPIRAAIAAFSGAAEAGLSTWAEPELKQRNH